ncbi:MAG: hypothetical protein FWC92_11095 [Defluviitaleaceae bacterium]|nr:hypothetical protein [Defluviitaleaceae bacterium]
MSHPIAFVIWNIAFFVFILMHELGHAAMSRILFKDKGWVITMGTGRPIFTSKRLVINTWFFIGGKINYSVLAGKRYKHILRAAGGILVNIVLAISIFVLVIHIRQYVQLYDFLPWWLIILTIEIAFMVNIISAVTAMIPIIYPFGVVKGMPSDGLWILRLIFNPSKYLYCIG